MTYKTVEASVSGGEPVELYKFIVGPSSYLYTSSGNQVSFSGGEYEPTAISRTEIDQNDEINRAGISITLPRGAAVTEEFRVYAPSSVVGATIFAWHPTADVYAAIWAGRVLSCEWRGVSATLACESVFSSQKRLGLRRNYQAACPHSLYDVPCGVSKTAYKVAGLITDVTANTLLVDTLGGYSAGYFSGGFVTRTEADGALDTRFITEHGGTSITLSHPFNGAEVGDAVDVYPGCAHTTAACDTKFSNILNYGGFPYVPEKSPFGSTSVF